MKRAVLLFFAVVFFLLPIFAQSGPAPDPQFSAQGGPASKMDQDQIKKMQKQQNVERQKQLKADTEKLLALATELKQSVDKTNENVLSLDVVRKAEEIEKLAKHIKTNMRDEVR